MYNCLRLFYLNGGGPAYIVSVGTYEADETIATQKEDNNIFKVESTSNSVNKAKLLEGLNTLPLIQFPKPTMILIPDTMALESADECYMVQQQMIAQAGDLKDRIALLDIYEGWKDYTQPDNDVIANFRNNMGVSNLSYAVAYYPWLQTDVVSAEEITYANIAPRPADAPATNLQQDINKLLISVPTLKVLKTISADYKTLEAHLLTTPHLAFTSAEKSSGGRPYPSWNLAFHTPDSEDANILQGQGVVLATMFELLYKLGTTGSFKGSSAHDAKIEINSSAVKNCIVTIINPNGSLAHKLSTAYSYSSNFPGISATIGLTQDVMKGLGWTTGDNGSLPTTNPYKFPDGASDDEKKTLAFSLVIVRGDLSSHPTEIGDCLA